MKYMYIESTNELNPTNTNSSLKMLTKNTHEIIMLRRMVWILNKTSNNLNINKKNVHVYQDIMLHGENIPWPKKKKKKKQEWKLLPECQCKSFRQKTLSYTN